MPDNDPGVYAAVQSNWFDNIEEARAVDRILRAAWWTAWKARAAELRAGMMDGPAEEVEPMVLHALNRAHAEAIAKFGKPAVPTCYECALVSVYGGPDHRPSSMCRSGGKPHCTCDTCF